MAKAVAFNELLLLQHLCGLPDDKYMVRGGGSSGTRPVHSALVALSPSLRQRLDLTSALRERAGESDRAPASWWCAGAAVPLAQAAVLRPGVQGPPVVPLLGFFTSAPSEDAWAEVQQGSGARQQLTGRKQAEEEEAATPSAPPIAGRTLRSWSIAARRPRAGAASGSGSSSHTAWRRCGPTHPPAVSMRPDEDSLWLVYKWEGLKPLSLYMERGAPEAKGGLFKSK